MFLTYTEQVLHIFIELQNEIGSYGRNMQQSFCHPCVDLLHVCHTTLTVSVSPTSNDATNLLHTKVNYSFTPVAKS